jgi:hypothetical protein
MIRIWGLHIAYYTGRIKVIRINTYYVLSHPVYGALFSYHSRAAILSNILMIVVISLTAVLSVLHAVALRRVVCEFPGGCCIKSLRLEKKKKKTSTSPPSGDRS